MTQLTKGFTLMQAQLKLAKGGVPKLEGDKFADVVEPFLEKAQVRVRVRVTVPTTAAQPSIPSTNGN